MGTDLVSDIIEHIVPTRNYKPSELAPLLGVSRSCIYKWIANGAIYVPNKQAQFLVTGERAIDFCRYHADWLELFSSFDGRQKLVRPKPYMLKRRKVHPPKRNLLDLRADVFEICEHLQRYYGRVTVRAVKPLVTGRTQHICRYVKQWKNLKAGIKPVKKAA